MESAARRRARPGKSASEFLVGSYGAAGTDRLAAIATLVRPTAARAQRWNDSRPDQDRLHRDRPEDEIWKEWQPATHVLYLLPIGCFLNQISPPTLRRSKNNRRISWRLWSSGRRYNRIRELARHRASNCGAGRTRCRRVAAPVRAPGGNPALRLVFGSKASP